MGIGPLTVRLDARIMTARIKRHYLHTAENRASMSILMVVSCTPSRERIPVTEKFMNSSYIQILQNTKFVTSAMVLAQTTRILERRITWRGLENVYLLQTHCREHQRQSKSQHVRAMAMDVAHKTQALLPSGGSQRHVWNVPTQPLQS